MGHVKLVGLSIIAAGAVLLPISKGVAHTPECVFADEWVTENIDALPRTWPHLSDFSRVYRRRIVAALPNEERVSLWEEHFAFMQANFDWNPEQRAFVDRAIALLPAVHESRPSDDWRMQFESEAVALFGEDQATLIFADIGASALSPATVTIGECGCAVGGFLNCGAGSECEEQNPGCQHTIMGCGGFLLWACNGQCEIT